MEKEIKAVLRTPEPEELVREYELVLLAHGSVQADPNIPGLEEFAGIEILDPRNMPRGKNVVIIGEGFSAVDAAEALADNNNSVTLVCKSREILPDSQMISRNIAVRSLENLNVRILVKSEVTRKKGDRVFVNYQGREQVIEGVDRVVVLEGMLPSSDYEKEL
ncbi:MAG: FAD-dependent oxidoreductase, partial [Deltaproteobacteria bacterium]|nr:FAD-dependent oxidoreductase [Deltaproteobacteria bacterium]